MDNLFVVSIYLIVFHGGLTSGLDLSDKIWRYELGIVRSNRQTVDLERKSNPQVTTVSSNRSETIQSESPKCDFGNQALKIAVSPQPPFADCLQDSLGEWNCNGSNIEVIRILGRRFNFKPEWIILTNNQMSFQDKQTNRTQKSKSREKFSAIFSLVENNRVAMSANGLIKTKDRQDRFWFSDSFDMFRIHLLLSKSVREHDHIFIKPFSSETWTAIILSALAVVPIFYALNTTTKYYMLIEDKPLSNWDLTGCIRYKLSLVLRGIKRTIQKISETPKKRLRSRHSSSSSSFDEELDRIAVPSAVSQLDNSLVAPLPTISRITKDQRQVLKYRWNYARKMAKRKAKLSQDSGFFKVAYIIWYVVSSLANQGGETEDLPQANSTRILVAFWWFYLIVVVAIHSGILTAILTFPRQNDFIQTLEDYLKMDVNEKESLKLSVDKHSEIANLLSNEDNLYKSPLALIMNQSREQNFEPFVYVDFQRHRERILMDVQSGTNAFIGEKSLLNHIITMEYLEQKPHKCLLKSSKFPIDVIPMHFILSKQIGSVCVESINRLLRFIMLHGLAIKWRRRYEPQGNDCLDSVVINAGDVDKIEYRHVEVAFWALIAGIGFGTIGLILEIVWLLTRDENETTNKSSSPSSIDSGLTSSSSSSSEDDKRMKLGYRPYSKDHNQSKSLRTRKRLKKLSKSKYPIVNDVPAIVMDEYRREGQAALEEALKRKLDQRNVLIKSTQQKVRRIKRAVDLVKRFHDGGIYSNKLRPRYQQRVTPTTLKA